jgi:hypothetical protein
MTWFGRFSFTFMWWTHLCFEERYGPSRSGSASAASLAGGVSAMMRTLFDQLPAQSGAAYAHASNYMRRLLMLRTGSDRHCQAPSLSAASGAASDRSRIPDR